MTDSNSQISIVAELPQDPAPKVFHDALLAILELGVLTYVALTKMVPIQLVLQTLEGAPAIRAKVYSACTGMNEKFAIKHSLDRQIEDINVALDTEDAVAERFVLTVGIQYYIEHVKLETIYFAMMEPEWVVKNAPIHRRLAARLNLALDRHDAFGPAPATRERILKAITHEQLFGDQMPAELRSRMTKAVDRGVRQFKEKRFSEFAFEAVSFEELSDHLDVAVMASPFAQYADALGLITAPRNPDSELPPGGETEMLIDVDDAQATSQPPPLPKQKEGTDGDSTG